MSGSFAKLLLTTNFKFEKTSNGKEKDPEENPMNSKLILL
jgi:hypothetical protein